MITYKDIYFIYFVLLWYIYLNAGICDKKKTYAVIQYILLA